MSTKIQINSLEALERLIGGDTEVELEIRNNIVQEFTKKHLKSLLETDSVLHKRIDDIRKSASSEITRLIHAEIGQLKNTWYGTEVQFEEPFLSKIKGNINSQMEGKIREVVAECISNFGDFKDKVAAFTKSEFDTAVRRAVREKLSEVLK